MSSPLQTILDLTPEAKKSGSGYSAPCPAHDDQHASLSITESADGKVLLYCHAGCDLASIVRAYGVEESDLFPPKDSTGKRIVAEYSYRDEAGTELFQSVRFEPKDFRQRHRENGAWIWDLKNVRRVLYGLPELRASTGIVYVVEGEKDVEAMRSLGLTATCNPMGAGKWRPEYADALRDRVVVVIADKDEPDKKTGRRPGQDHAATVAASIPGAVVVEVPTGKDASDWIAAGAIAEDFGRLKPAEDGTPDTEPDGPSWITLSDVEPERVEWLQFHRIALGKLNLMDGDPGLGKGLAMMSLFAAITTGSELPGGGSFGPADVILLSSEDGIGDTLRPRLDAAGGDPARVHLLEFVRCRGAKLFPSLKRDMAALEEGVVKWGARFIGIDPFMGFLGVKDAHKDADVKETLGPLAQMLDRLKVAALGIRHLNKSQVAASLYRGGGSIGIIGAARSAYLLARDPDDENRLIVAATKANLGPKPASLAFRIVGTPNGSARAVWEPHTNEHTADALLRSAIETQGGRRAGTEAAEWLEGALRGGPVPAKELQDECQAKGICSFKTARETAKKMGVVFEKSTGKRSRGIWTWRKPGDQLSLPPVKGKVPSSKLQVSPSLPSSMFSLVSLSEEEKKKRTPKSAESLDCGSARYTAADLIDLEGA